MPGSGTGSASTSSGLPGEELCPEPADMAVGDAARPAHHAESAFNHPQGGELVGID